MPKASCPSCRVVIKASDEYAGKNVRCPSCQTKFQFPIRVVSVPVATAVPVQEPQFHCPFCKSSSPPLRKSKMSQLGMTVLIVVSIASCGLGLLFFWVPMLFMREEYRECVHCGMKIG